MTSVGRTIAGRNNNYTSIRCLLAATVIYYHSFPLSQAVGYTDYANLTLRSVELTTGDLAVDCFFFLSGLFVTQSFFRDRSPINFAIRRFCRIWPGLFVCVTITAIIACILSKRLGALWYFLEPGFYNYVIRNSMLSLVWQIPGVFEGRPYPSINGSLHTLPMEATMYVVLLGAGLLMLLQGRQTIFVVGIGILAASLYDYGFFVRHLALPVYGQTAMAMFFAGVALFAVADYVRARWWFVAVCLGLAVVMPGALGTAGALAAAASAMLVVGQMEWRWRPRSDVSYGIYIYGWPCQQFILTFFPRLNPYLLFGAALLLAWGFAALSWRLVERPAIVAGQGLAGIWTEFHAKAWLSAALARLLAIAALPRFATVCVIFLLCVAMGWAAERINVTPITPLDVRIVGFGPAETKAGQSFNVQPNGASAMWVAFDKPPPPGTQIVVDGVPLETVLGPKIATAAVPERLFASPGDRAVLLQLRLPGQRQRSAPVTLRVTE